MRSAVPPLVVTSRVIIAVLLREARTRFGKSQLGYFWALFEPIAHVGIFCAIFLAIGRATPIGGNTPLFILTGVVPWLTFSNIVSRTSRAVDGNRALLTYPHVTPLDVMAARVLLEAATMIWVFLLLLIAITALGGKTAIDKPLDLVVAFTTLIILASGIGLINATIISFFDGYERIFSAFLRVAYFVSGIFFTVDHVPPQARDWILWNPIMHLIEWIRSAFFADFDSKYADRPFAVATAVLCLLIGLVAERAARARVKEGS